jgi:hypothetical protein
LNFEAKIKIIRTKSATKRLKFEAWYIKISDFRNKKEQRKFTLTDRRESRQQENEAKPSRGTALGFRNLSLTRKIINIKA